MSTEFDLSKAGDTAFADALLRAREKAARENKPKEQAISAATSVLLPDLEKIEVSEVALPTLEGAKETIRTEAEGTRQWAEAAGAKIVQLRGNLEKIRGEIRNLEKDPNSKFSSTAQNMIGQLKAAENREKAKLDQLLSVENEAVRAHAEFSALVEEIRGTDPSHLGEVREIYSRVIKLGHRQIVSKKEIDNTQATGKPLRNLIFFEGVATVPAFNSAGGRALDAELRKLTDAAKLSKAASIKTRGNADLSGFENGKPGLYYFFSPKRTEKAYTTEGGVQIPERKFYEGHILVELRDVNKGKFDWKDGKKVFRSPFVVVEVKDAIGSLARFVSDRWIPHYWVKSGRIVPSKDKDGKPKRLEQEDFDRAVRLIRTLRALYAVWHKGLNPEVAKPEKSDEPAYTTPVVDITDVVVETVASEKTEKPAIEKPTKTKKAKKA